ncbi:MAG: hypothetical protein QJR02_14250 [Sinobacteraceae bacterium]|nr:hypothetical protein [Nevskiaceae bacterium]
MIVVHRLTSAMVAVQQLVAREFYWHTGGVIPLEKAERVVEKFGELYGIEESPSADRARRRRGEARTRIVLWPDGGGLGFFLLATDGPGTVKEQERLQDAREARQRVRIRDYELAMLPRRGDVPRWTWRIELDRYRDLLDEGCRYARREDQSAAVEFIRALLKRPGFNGVRTQQRAILAAMRHDARRAGRPPLLVVERLPWVRAHLRRTEPLPVWLAEETRRRALMHVTR